DGPLVPRHLTTAEFVTAVRRVLRPGGVYVANLIDDPPHRLARRQISTIAAAFSEALLLAERPVLTGRRTGNPVVAATDRRLPPALRLDDPLGLALGLGEHLLALLDDPARLLDLLGDRGAHLVEDVVDLLFVHAHLVRQRDLLGVVDEVVEFVDENEDVHGY